MFKVFSITLIIAFFASPLPLYASQSDLSQETETKKRSNPSVNSSAKRQRLEVAALNPSPVLPVTAPKNVEKSQLRLFTYLDVCSALKKINPLGSGQNGLACCQSFVKWVITGELVPANDEAPKGDDVLYAKNFDKLPTKDWNLKTISKVMKLQQGDPLYEYIEPQTEGLNFLRVTMSNFKKKLNKDSAGRIEVNGGWYQVGIIYLKSVSNVNNTYDAQFFNFYTYEANGQKKIVLIIDPQTGTKSVLSKSKDLNCGNFTNLVYYWKYKDDYKESFQPALNKKFEKYNLHNDLKQKRDLFRNKSIKEKFNYLMENFPVINYEVVPELMAVQCLQEAKNSPELTELERKIAERAVPVMVFNSCTKALSDKEAAEILHKQVIEQPYHDRNLFIVSMMSYEGRAQIIPKEQAAQNLIGLKKNINLYHGSIRSIKLLMPQLKAVVKSK